MRLKGFGPGEDTSIPPVPVLRGLSTTQPFTKVQQVVHTLNLFLLLHIASPSASVTGLRIFFPKLRTQKKLTLKPNHCDFTLAYLRPQAWLSG